MAKRKDKQARTLAAAEAEAERLKQACADRKPIIEKKQRKKRPLYVRGGVRHGHASRLKHSHFMAVEYYMRGMSKKDALIKAGYAESTANKVAFQIFGREDVQAAIEERRWALRSRSHEIVDRIKEELGRIAFFNIGSFVCVTDDGGFIFDFDEATMEDFAALGEVTVEQFMEGQGEDARPVRKIKVKPYDKKAALDSLARIYGMFQDNLNVTTPGESVEERLARGRDRVNKGVTVEGEVAK